MSARSGLEPSSQIGDGILQIRLPMTGNPLRYVNGYLIADDGGYTLIDCGWKADDVLHALRAALKQGNVAIGDLRRIAVTHVHHDHYGLAGTLRQGGVPELLIHPADWEFARKHLLDPAAAERAADEWLARNGFDASQTVEDEQRREQSELTPPTGLIEDGARIGRLRAVWTPGHTPGHLCYLDTVSGRILTGDHVLDPITPHVGIWGGDRGDPLGAYLHSLRTVAAIETTGVLPAHGEPFGDLRGRVEQLLAHHGVRERQVLEALGAGTMSAAQIARALPWTRRDRSFDELGEMHQQFAVAETIAHLEHLRVRAVVVRDPTSAPITYAPAAA